MKNCKHEWVYLKTIDDPHYEWEKPGDHFYCKFCLKIKVLELSKEKEGVE